MKLIGIQITITFLYPPKKINNLKEAFISYYAGLALLNNLIES